MLVKYPEEGIQQRKNPCSIFYLSALGPHNLQFNGHQRHFLYK